MFSVTHAPSPRSTLFPYTTLFRSRVVDLGAGDTEVEEDQVGWAETVFGSDGSQLGEPSVSRDCGVTKRSQRRPRGLHRDRKSTRLNSSHVEISYAVFCLKKKNKMP